MNYDFKSLSYADFEDLVRELIGRELGLRFEAFTPGPDGGMDGRHARGARTTILQAKHLAGSSFAQLKSAMQRDRKTIHQLGATRYVLATSRSLTPVNKASLANIIGSSLRLQDDIFGPHDLNSILRKYPEIERAHIKLWMSSSTVLDRLVHAAAHTINSITRKEIAAKMAVYAQNPSFPQSRSILEREHVLIISGPPGVGKTTLAELLSFAYLNEDWELVAVRSLDDGFSAIVDTKKQIFFFDDFLGKIALDKSALATKDSDLSRFIWRVRNSPNARFVLTTRAYLFEEGRRVSEYLADQKLDISKYVLDVGIYTRRIRARILYNHLVAADAPTDHIQALILSKKLALIIDHRNYNPRVIEWMTDKHKISATAAKDYPNAFIAALDNPDRLWDTAFRTHISNKCRHLLLAMFFSSQYGVSVVDLQKAFEALNEVICKQYDIPREPKDFEEAIKVLEGSFISVRGDNVTFINPSLRDYIHGYASHYNILCICALASQTVDWAETVWTMASSLELNEYQRRELVLAFKSIASRFEHLPTWKLIKSKSNSYHRADKSNGDRLELLLAWWEATEDSWFAERVVEVAGNPVSIGLSQGFDSWRDSQKIIQLVCELKGEDYYVEFPLKYELIQVLEDGLSRMISGGMSLDEMVPLSDAVEVSRGLLRSDVVDELTSAIRDEFDHVKSVVQYVESESTLDDHISALEKLAPRAGIDKKKLASAVAAVQERMSELVEDTSEAEAPKVPVEKFMYDKFDDADLYNLFHPLLESR